MKKIMFNDRYGLTQSVLEGKKTMTRRIIHIDLYNQTDWKAFEEGDYEVVVDGDGYYHDIRLCGMYQIGEEVAVAQSYKDIYHNGSQEYGSYELVRDFKKLKTYPYQDITLEKGWINKMFVKADLMPHRIRITNIKVELLQDISDEDCLREGIRKSIVEFGGKKIVQWTYFHKKRTIWFDSPREAFAALIDRISGKGTWERNPWCFCYEFELIR